MTTVKQERNVEGLRQNAQKKRQQAIERTEQGIKQLMKEGRAITFKAVSEVADVSSAWLYKESEIKAKIEHLREQGSKKKLPSKQKASDVSKEAMIRTLKDKISKLDAENQELRKQLEVIYAEVLETRAIKHQVEQLKAENSKLKNQLENCMDSKPISRTVKLQSEAVSLPNKKTVHQL
jgi:predicted RNase H-like nuclease (RuvC/YqgF family)